MSNKARQYNTSTIKRLFSLSGNQCAKPDCLKELIAEDGKTFIGQIAHIEGAKPRGPRYNPEMEDTDRADFQNLILLCDEHHKIIDNKTNEEEYPKKLLQEWKKQHEEKFEKDKFKVPDGLIEQIINKLDKYFDELMNKFLKTTLEADRTILDEIFDYIFKNKIDEDKAKRRLSKNGIEITKKIKLNFSMNQKHRINQIFSFYLKYEYLIREFIEIEGEQNPFRIDGLKEFIQEQYCTIQNLPNTDTPIKDIKIFVKIAKKLLPQKKQENPNYISNAKLIVLYFFEQCDFGKKNENETDSQLELFKI